MSQTLRGPSALVVRLSMGLLCLIWGSTYLAIRFGLEDLPAFQSAAVRFFLAWLVLLAVAPPLVRREGGARPTLGLVLAMGGINVALTYGIIYWCGKVLPSGLIAVLWAVYPLMMALAAHFFLPDERLRPRQALGFLVGFAGVAYLFRTDLVALGPEGLPAGALLLLSPLVHAIGTLILKRYGAGTSSVLLTRSGMLTGALGLAAAALLLEDAGTARWTWRALLSVLYLALLGTVLAFTLYYWLLRHAPASELSLIAYVIPVIALTVGALLGGEPLTRTTLQGSGIVLLGVALASRPAAPKRGTAPAPERAAGEPPATRTS